MEKERYWKTENGKKIGCCLLFEKIGEYYSLSSNDRELWERCRKIDWWDRFSEEKMKKHLENIIKEFDLILLEKS